MNKILLVLILVLLVMGNASALLNPNTAINWSKTINDDITLGTGYGVTGTASRIAVGTFIDTGYGLKNSTANKIQVNISADHGLQFGATTHLGELQVDPTDIIDTAYGIKEGSDKIQINLSAGKGLDFDTGAAYGALRTDPTDFIDTSYGIYESSDKLRVNLTANKGLEFGTTAAAGSLQIKLDGTTLQLGSSGIKVNPDLALTTATIDSKLVPNVIIVSVPIPAAPVDGTIFIAPFACKVIDIVEAHEVSQATAYPNTGSVTLYAATNGQAANAGTVLHNTTMWLNSTANTPQGPVLNAATGATTLASSGRVVADFNGTVTTYSGGCITLQIQKL